MNLDQDFFQACKLSEDQKKNTFFPRIQVQTCTQMHIFGGDVGEDHTQILGGDTVKLLGGYIPHPPAFGTLG